MNNLWSRFRDLNPKAKRVVGTCIRADTGECTIQFPGGSLIQARGVAVEGQRYFVLDGQLDGDAPTLATLEIEV